MKRSVPHALRALALALAGLASVAVASAKPTGPEQAGPGLLAQATGTPGSSGAAPPPPTPPAATSPRGSGASVFDSPQERDHSGASNSASGIQGSARVPRAIHRDREPSNPATQPFACVDRNGDGVLDRGEARSVDGLSFDRVDTNQNGRIEPREYEADAQARRQ